MKQKLFEFFTVLIDNISQRKNILLIKNYIGKDLNVFFDVGSHKCESIEIFNKYFSIKQIYAFEANSDLIQKIDKLKYPNTIFTTKGIGERNQKKKFFQSNFTAISSFNNFQYDSKYSKFKERVLSLFYPKQMNLEKLVDIISLDYFCKKNKIKYIDILKIDTEGYELKVLKGLKKSIQNVKIILFEHHYDNSLKKEYTFKDINTLLKDNGFKKVAKNKMVFRKIFEYIYINTK